MDILNNGQPDGQEVVSAHECRDLLKDADEDGDRRISFLEFLNMMKGTTDLSKVKKEKDQKKSAKLEAALQAGEDAAAQLLEVTNEDGEPPTNVEAPELSEKPLEEADGTELPSTETAAQEEPPVRSLGSDAAANSVDNAPESASQSAEGDSLNRGSQELALPALPAEHERRDSASASEPPGSEAKAKKDKKEKKEKKAKKEKATTEAPLGEAEAAAQV